jgi:hypothetical protein
VSFGTADALAVVMLLVALLPAAVACVLFVETLRIRPAIKY